MLFATSNPCGFFWPPGDWRPSPVQPYRPTHLNRFLRITWVFSGPFSNPAANRLEARPTPTFQLRNATDLWLVAGWAAGRSNWVVKENENKFVEVGTILAQNRYEFEGWPVAGRARRRRQFSGLCGRPQRLRGRIHDRSAQDRFERATHPFIQPPERYERGGGPAERRGGQSTNRWARRGDRRNGNPRSTAVKRREAQAAPQANRTGPRLQSFIISQTAWWGWFHFGTSLTGC